MAAFLWGNAGEMLTPEQILVRRKMAQSMLDKGMDASPVQSWTQGAARVAQGIFGGMMARDADLATKANAGNDAKMISAMFGIPVAGASPNPPAAAAAPVFGTSSVTAGAPYAAAPASAPADAGAVPVDPQSAGSQVAALAPAADRGSMLDRLKGAVGKFESGNRYGLLGPVTRTGDRAYGKYQVMGANVPEWTQAALGRPMTPQEFLASPDAQEKVTDHRLGMYLDKYGPEGASRAWFAGEKGMHNPRAKDVLGTDVAGYSRNVMSIYGQDSALPPTASLAAGDALGSPPGAAQRVAQAMIPQQRVPDPGMAGMAPYIAAMTSPYSSPAVKSVAGIMLQKSLDANKVTHIDLGNAIGMVDARGNIRQMIPKGEPNKGPEYGVVGKDQFGVEQYGWKNPRDMSVTPYNVTPQTPPGESVIPAAPPGVDPKIWRDAHSKRTAENAVPASFEDASKLRHEVMQSPAYKNLAQAAPIYESMRATAGTNSRASDLNLVYGLGKIFDPGSVVREGEMVMVKKTASIPDWLVGAITSLNGGAALTPQTRAAILQEAHNRITAYKGEYDQTTSHYRGIAKRNRMSEEDIIPEFKPFVPWTPSSAPASGGSVTRGGVKWKVE